MTDTIHKPDMPGTQATPPVRRATPRRSQLGPLGYGNGPVLAAGVVVGGAVLFAGWGAAQILAPEEGSASKTTTTSQQDSNKEGTGTVTLPDRDNNRDNNGAPDAFEDSDDGVDNGRGDEGDTTKTPAAPEPKRETRVYVIEPGDTLTKISRLKRVPVGILVEKNRIQNPNLIYAGASLLIPPV